MTSLLKLSLDPRPRVRPPEPPWSGLISDRYIYIRFIYIFLNVCCIQIGSFVLFSRHSLLQQLQDPARLVVVSHQSCSFRENQLSLRSRRSEYFCPTMHWAPACHTLLSVENHLLLLIPGLILSCCCLLLCSHPQICSSQQLCSSAEQS